MANARNTNEAVLRSRQFKKKRTIGVTLGVKLFSHDTNGTSAQSFFYFGKGKGYDTRHASFGVWLPSDETG